MCICMCFFVNNFHANRSRQTLMYLIRAKDDMDDDWCLRRRIQPKKLNVERNLVECAFRNGTFYSRRQDFWFNSGVIIATAYDTMVFSLLENICEITSTPCRGWNNVGGGTQDANTFTVTIRRGFLITTRNQGGLFA